MRHLHSMLAAALAMTPLAAHAQSVADQKAIADLDLARANAEKARLDALAALRAAAAGTGASTTTTEKSAEALILKYAAYRGLATLLVNRFGEVVPASKAVQPIVVMGTTPPSVSAWLSFDAKHRLVTKNMLAAQERWGRATGSTKMMAVPVGIVLTVLSAFRTETAITGGALTLDDAKFASLVTGQLQAGYAPDLDAFRVARTSDANVDGLLGSDAMFYNALTDILKVRYPALVKKTEQAGEELPDAVKDAIKDVQTAVTDYETLRDSLYSDSGGRPLGSVITKQKALAEDDGSKFPVIYVTSQEGALTTITRKNFLTGFGSTPATLSAATTLTYTIVGRHESRCAKHRALRRSMIRARCPGASR